MGFGTLRLLGFQEGTVLKTKLFWENVITMESKMGKLVIPNHIKIGVLVGGVGFLMGMLLMFVFMGLPVGSMLLAIPVGIATGRLLVGGGNPGESIPEKLTVWAGFISVH